MTASGITAGIEETHHKKRCQRPLIRVGFWKTAASTDGTSLPSNSQATVLTRSGTDIFNEEHELDSVRPRTSNLIHPVSGQNHAFFENGRVRSNMERRIVSYLSAELPEYEWYWILIIILSLSASSIIIYTLVVSGRIITFYRQILVSLSVALGFSIFYTGFFVQLSLLHDYLGSRLERYLKLNRRIQRKVLRTLAWAGVVCVLVVVLTIFSTQLLVVDK